MDRLKILLLAQEQRNAEQLVTVDKETAALVLHKPEQVSLEDWDVNVEHFRVAPVSHVADDIETRRNLCFVILMSL